MRHIAFPIQFTGVFIALAVITPAWAHIGVAPHTHALGFTAGFSHPWLGLDHLLAMVAVGLLAVRAHEQTPGNRALWLLPAGFVCGMMIGGLAAFATLPVPGVELAIASSVILLGCALAFMPRVPAVPAALLVAVAGFFHGHAHITEMSGTIMSYATGMILATALLHAIGVGAGVALARRRAAPIIRFSGLAMAAGFALILI